MNFELGEKSSPIMNGSKDENGKCRAVRHTRGPLPEREDYANDTTGNDTFSLHSDSDSDTECESSPDISSGSNTE